MKRLLILLAVLLLLPWAAMGEDGEDWDTAYDWRAEWEEYGYAEFGDVQEDTLIVFEGVTALGTARTYAWDAEQDDWVEVEPKFEDGPCFDGWMYGRGIHRASLPATLRYLGMEAFFGFDFDEFTLPAQLEVLEDDAFYACSFGVLRIETTLPAADILNAVADSTVYAYEAPEDHPLYKTIDGVLFSKDGKTLLAYPNGRRDAHYDVPAGVERIEKRAFNNENLKTISLPIGLKSVADYGFAGCTRLQAIVLPLTVTEIGKEIFYCCVSLELVSLPEGLEAEKDDSGYWVEYYPDDALFRGDNGDTLAGERSEGWIGAPGRIRTMAKLYSSADGIFDGKVLVSKRAVYMSHAQNGLVAVTEPLTGQELGWAALEDLEYLPQETLFEYADVQPQKVMEVWWNRFPDQHNSRSWMPWETKIHQDGREYEVSFYGPFLCFREWGSGARFGCRIQDAVLTRVSDGTENVYGVVYDAEDCLNDILLYGQPGGETVKALMGGTQIQILDEKEGWVQVTDGRDTGWVENTHVMIVPEEQKEGE